MRVPMQHRDHDVHGREAEAAAEHGPELRVAEHAHVVVEADESGGGAEDLRPAVLLERDDDQLHERVADHDDQDDDDAGKQQGQRGRARTRCVVRAGRRGGSAGGRTCREPSVSPGATSRVGLWVDMSGCSCTIGGCHELHSS